MDNMEVRICFLDPRELTTVQLGALYTRYGYQVRIVEYGKDESDPKSDVRINYDVAASMEWAWREIRKIQSAARSGKPIVKPRWPLVVAPGAQR
jgi:xylulose-5-phosphate/fructose-6-phosphate phosphoketolase